MGKSSRVMVRPLTKSNVSTMKMKQNKARRLHFAQESRISLAIRRQLWNQRYLGLEKSHEAILFYIFNNLNVIPGNISYQHFLTLFAKIFQSGKHVMSKI